MTTAEMLETRSLFDCTEELGNHPGSFVVLELRARNAPALVQWLSQLDQEDCQARAAVVADRSLDAWEQVVREAGAVWFVTSPRNVGLLARMARRHLQTVPKPRRDLVEEVWDWLPWARYAGLAAGENPSGPALGLPHQPSSLFEP